MSAYRPPMSKSTQPAWRSNSTASTAPRSGESRTWTARPTESNSGGRQFNRPPLGDRPSAGYRNDRPSSGYRNDRSVDHPRSPRAPTGPPQINSNDFPSLTSHSAVERPKVPWTEMATKKTPEPTAVEPKAPESGWSNVVVKMATQVSQAEAQLAEEKRIRLEKEHQQTEANKAYSKGQFTFYAPFVIGSTRRPQSVDDEDDDYIPPPAYGHQTPLDDDDYDGDY